ncbi:MAG: hypothetical protein JSS98_07670 [Bacteroidetes bacterium]|nr:hypothetical protein [Bacteroidota bacterium]
MPLLKAQKIILFNDCLPFTTAIFLHYQTGKLKANRIGWIYITIDPVTQKVANTAKSGWDTIAGTAWTNF